MGEITTILAALDLEAGSDVVLVRAVQLASVHGALLIVLHVIDDTRLASAAAQMEIGESELRDRLRRQALAAIEALLVGNKGRNRRRNVEVDFGSPHEIITEVACERGADVIVLGPGKGHTLKDKFLGSTADRVIRASAVPVLVVRKPSVAPYRSVAVAVDGSKPSAEAFIAARRQAPDASFQLVHAVDIPLPFQQAMMRAGTSRAEMDEYRAAHASKARDELAAFQRDLPGTPEFPVRLLEGEPGPALVRLSMNGRIDLLALGSRGRGAALQAILGSVARRVLGEAACDVLVANIQQ